MNDPTPLDRAAAHAELRALGRRLDQQVATRTAATAPELDATLDAMRAVHTRLAVDLTGPRCPEVP
ncbi:hypothetical protein [Kitasatospora sp. NBC_01266]|uniref:hypothetical protein n=1 Tax=Kitasatospora sp. NBC_01266 TaxID=2903572 RepID=UPI002E32D554|nr:hypothetical protein [Kitasatospora sp. NBC_01266]